MMDRTGQEIAFKGIDTSEPYVPAISLGANQHARVNFGQVSFSTWIKGFAFSERFFRKMAVLFLASFCSCIRCDVNIVKNKNYVNILF